MRTPFGADWDDLSVAHLISFFAEPRNEGLRWEAKGGDIRREHIREGVCGFANSIFGGFLVLGATQDRATKRWMLDHWQPRDEVELWVQNCVGGGGVDPAPSIDTKAWPLDDGGWLACILIYPVAVPPAITSEGGVWVRTSGATPQVKDAATLRELIARGEASRERAARLSLDAADGLFRSPPEGRNLLIVAGAAAPSVPAEVSHKIFRESFWRGPLQHQIEGPLARSAAPGLGGFAKVHTDMNQGAVTVWNDDGFHPDSGFTIVAGRQGTVAVGYSDSEVDSGIDWARLETSSLRSILGAAVHLLAELGGMGPAHLSLRFTDRFAATIDVSRWTEIQPVSDELLASIIRETRRAQGDVEPEPEP